MADLHTLEGPGVTVENTTFRLHQGLPTGTWRVNDGELRHDANPDEELTADAVRCAIEVFGQPEREPLQIYAAHDLRRRLRGIVEGFEAKQRQGKEEAAREDQPMNLWLAGRIELDEEEKVVIGGVPLYSAMDAHWGRSDIPVEVYVGIERQAGSNVAAGPVEVEPGFKGGEITPAELLRIEVGGVDLLEKLRGHVGEYAEVLVREVQPSEPFLIEVDVNLQRNTWIVPDPRFAGEPRPDEALDGERLIELVGNGARRIKVSFGSADAVYDAIEEYKAQRSPTRVWPEIEVVPGKGRADKVLVGNVDLNVQLVGNTPDETAAGARAINAYREGKVLIIATREAAEHVEDRALIEACNEALDFADTVHAEVVEEEVTDAELTVGLPPVDLIPLFEDAALKVFIDPYMPTGIWKISGPESSRARASVYRGGFTASEFIDAIAQHGFPARVVVSRSLMVNAGAALVTGGMVRRNGVVKLIDAAAVRMACTVSQ